MTSSVSMTRLGRSAEKIYAIGTLFALTQGPVYRIWESSANSLQTSPQPSMPHVHFATFVAVQLPAVLLLGRDVRGLLRVKKSLILLAILMSWLGMTVLWSTLARHSLPEYVALVLTTAFGVYLSTRFLVEEIWRIIAAAMATGLGFSLFAVWRSWNAAVSAIDGHWIGIYYNRNSLAPVAAVAATASIGMAVTRRRSLRVTNLWSVCGFVLIAISVLLLWKSRSQTSWFALIAALVALLMWLALRWISEFRSSSTLWGSPAVATLLLTATALFIALRFIGRLSSASGEITTFNSRGALWSLSWSAIQSKPWHGWGWLAAWHTPEFFRQGTYWAVWDTTWSHNGYHDLMLGGGFIAFGLFVAYLVSAARDIDMCSRRVGGMALFMAVFVLAAATQESFFIGSHFLWALLICATTVRWGKPLKSFEQQDTTKNLF